MSRRKRQHQPGVTYHQPLRPGLSRHLRAMHLATVRQTEREAGQ